MKKRISTLLLSFVIVTTTWPAMANESRGDDAESEHGHSVISPDSPVQPQPRPLSPEQSEPNQDCSARATSDFEYCKAHSQDGSPERAACYFSLSVDQFNCHCEEDPHNEVCRDRYLRENRICIEWSGYQKDLCLLSGQPLNACEETARGWRENCATSYHYCRRNLIVPPFEEELVNVSDGSDLHSPPT
jgi:hypothetical protein